MPEADMSDLVLTPSDEELDMEGATLQRHDQVTDSGHSSEDATTLSPLVQAGAHRHGFVPWPGMEENEEIPTLIGAGQSQVMGAAAAATEDGATVKQVPEPYTPYMVSTAAPIRETGKEMGNERSAREVAYLSEPEDLPVDEGELEDTELKASEQVPLIKDEVLPEPPPDFPTAEPAPFPFSVTPLAHDFAFEPLHTVDYFASQGIKLDLDENPTDNLSKHLKSFTEWLKSMKRLSPLDKHEELDAATEAEIQLLASGANQQREAIVTESMAHVWVLQGKIQKAIEVYNKLSLQHPEKRAYFASKIDHLNRL
jgi:hypothetical protein